MTQPAEKDPRWYRVSNALLLPLCADLLAAPFDGQALPDAVSVDAVLRTPAVLAQHLNTVHALAVAEHLASHQGGLDEDELAATMARQWATGEHSDPMAATAEALSDIHHGTPWWQAATAAGLRHPDGSADPAVRSVSCGLLPDPGLTATAMLARRTASLTHAGAVSRDAAALSAVAVALAGAEPVDRLSPQRFLTTLAEHTGHHGLRRGLAVARKLVGHRAGPAETAAIIGNTSPATRVIPAALVAFLRYPADPVAAIRFAILIGGHTRHIAAITAAIAGAHHPTDQVPAHWSHLTRARRANLTVSSLAVAGRQIPASAGPQP